MQNKYLFYIVVLAYDVIENSDVTSTTFTFHYR